MLAVTLLMLTTHAADVERTCFVDTPWAHGRAAQWIVGDVARAVKVTGSRVALPETEHPEVGLLSIDGFVPVRVERVAAGGDIVCPRPIPLTPAADALTGTVGPQLGRRTEVSTCAGDVEVDADGRFAITAVPGQCVVEARRHDDPLSVAVSEPIVYTIRPGERAVLTVPLPDEPVASYGFTVRWLGGEPFVFEVAVGSDAHAAGIAPGHRLISVDDLPAAEAWRDTGPIDETAVLRLDTGDEVLVVNVVRRPLRWDAPIHRPTWADLVVSARRTGLATSR